MLFNYKMCAEEAFKENNSVFLLGFFNFCLHWVALCYKKIQVTLVCVDPQPNSNYFGISFQIEPLAINPNQLKICSCEVTTIPPLRKH